MLEKVIRFIKFLSLIVVAYLIASSTTRQYGELIIKPYKIYPYAIKFLWFYSILEFILFINLFRKEK